MKVRECARDSTIEEQCFHHNGSDGVRAKEMKRVGRWVDLIVTIICAPCMHSYLIFLLGGPDLCGLVTLQAKAKYSRCWMTTYGGRYGKVRKAAVPMTDTYRRGITLTLLDLARAHGDLLLLKRNTMPDVNK